jgi:hypothetical protein
MAEQKHTPGPWAIFKVRLSGMFLIGKAADVDLANSDGHAMADNEADARLIAAAPDLLAALEVCAEELRNISSNVLMNAAYQNARAAISKATGEA